MEHLAELLVKSGDEKDLQESMKWRHDAAGLGLIQSQIELGLVYMHGLFGTEQDQPQGFEWLLKAAEQGDARAQHMISVCYMRGDGVEKNIEKVKEWTTKAAALLHRNRRGEKSIESFFLEFRRQRSSCACKNSRLHH